MLMHDGFIAIKNGTKPPRIQNVYKELYHFTEDFNGN
jgi:hypothetical protein